MTRDELDALIDEAREAHDRTYGPLVWRGSSNHLQAVFNSESYVSKLLTALRAEVERRKRVEAAVEELEHQSETLDDSLPSSKVIEADIHTFNWTKSVGRVHALNDAVKAIRHALADRADAGTGETS